MSNVTAFTLEIRSLVDYQLILDHFTVVCLACVASVPVRSEREKWGESKKVEGRGWGRGKKGTLARKPLDFEKRPLVFTVEFIY